MPASSLDIAVLGLLKEGPMHGYELRKRLSATMGPLYAVSYGSLYPCLKKLRKADFLVERPAPSEDRGARKIRRPKGLTESAASQRARAKAPRRAKKVYEITPAGETFFFDQLEQGAVYDTDRFQTRFRFFRYLSAESRIGQLERRRAYLQEKLYEFQESLKNTKERIDAYTRSLIEHSVEATEQDIRWLDDLIAKERRPRKAAARGGST